MSLNAPGFAYSVGLMKPTVPRPALTLAEFTRLTVYAYVAMCIVSKGQGDAVEKEKESLPRAAAKGAVALVPDMPTRLPPTNTW